MEYKPVDNRVVDAMVEASESTTPEEKNTLRLSKGVTIGFQKVPVLVFEKIGKKYVDPPVPVVYDPDKDRSYPNPDHPDYKKALEQNEVDRNMAFADALMGLGTYPIEIEDGLQKPEDTEWREELEFLTGIEVPKVKIGVWLYYLKYYAIQSQDEIKEIVRLGNRVLGVTEAEVSSAVDRFRNQEEWGTDSTGSAEA